MLAWLRNGPGLLVPCAYVRVAGLSSCREHDVASPHPVGFSHKLVIDGTTRCLVYIYSGSPFSQVPGLLRRAAGNGILLGSDQLVEEVQAALLAWDASADKGNLASLFKAKNMTQEQRMLVGRAIVQVGLHASPPPFSMASLDVW